MGQAGGVRRAEPSSAGEQADRAVAARRRAPRAVHVLLLGASFASAAALGIALHLGLAAPRRLTARLLSNLLSRELTGTFAIERFDRIGLDGFDGAVVEVRDERGNAVVRVSGLRARAEVPSVVFSLLRASRPLDLFIRRVRCEHADVVIEPDSSGEPSIVRAFTPRPPPENVPASAPRSVRVWLPRVVIASAHVRARLGAELSPELEVSNLLGSVLAGTERVVVDARRFGLNLRGAGLDRAQGTAELHVEHTPAGWSYRGSFEGFAGEVETQLHATYDAGKLKLSADVPSARPESVRALVRGLPVFDTVRLHLDADGALPLLHARADVGLGSGSFDVEGNVRVADPLSADFYFDARAVPLRALAPGAPEVVVGASGHVTAGSGPDGKLVGGYEMATDPIALGDSLPFPAASASGRFGASFADGNVVLYEPGALTKGHFEVREAGTAGKPAQAGKAAGPVVQFDASSQIPSIERAPRLRSFVRGGASIRAHGRVSAGELDVAADVRLDHPSRGLLSAQAAGAHVEIRGPASALAVEASGSLEQPRAGALAFSEARLEASGPLAAPRVEAALRGAQALPDIDARARVTLLGGRPALRELDVALSRGKLRLTGRARAIRWDESGIDIEDARLEGAGAPLTGSLALRSDSFSVSAHSPGLDLDALAQAAGLPEALVRGRASIDAEITARAGREKGHARVAVENGAIGSIDGIDAHAEGDLEGRELTLGAQARAGRLGSLLVTTHPMSLAGSALSGRSWIGATGVVLVDATADLDALNAVVPGYLLPFDEIKGTVSLKGAVSREGPSAWPDVNAVVWTAGLATSPARTWSADESRSGSRGLLLDGVDVQAGLNFAGADGRTQATVRLVDDEGIFVSLSGVADLPVRELLAGGPRASDLLMHLPASARLLVPRRPLQAFPSWFRPAGLLGELELTADVSGTASKPTMRAHVSGRGLRGEAAAVAVPVDGDLDAVYDGTSVELRAGATHQNSKVLDVVGRIALPWNALVAPGDRAPLGWQAQGFARLAGFPLEAIPGLADRGIAGGVAGEMALSGLHADPHLVTRVRLERVRIGAASFPSVQAFGSIEGGMGTASVRFDQSDGGYLAATGSARVSWGSELLPSISPATPADIYVSAERLRAAALYPLVEGLFSHVDGRIDANLHLRQSEQGNRLEQTVEGGAELRDGVLQIPEVGQELHGASARLSFGSGGVVKLESLEARGLAGRLRATGEGTLDGFWPRSGNLHVAIAEREAIPLTLEGVSLGDAWGRLEMTAQHERGDRRVRVDVQVPELHADIPESTARDVQSLSDNPAIRIGRRVADGSLEPVALGPPEETRSGGAFAWRFAFHLGDAVTIKRGSSLQLAVRGEPVVTLTDRARVAGQIELANGVIDLLGKRFSIEHGTAAFDEGTEPGNPFLTVRARWDAPDGTRVYADYVGPLKTGTLNLSAEPAHTRSEILALLLFGSETGAPGSGVGDSQSSSVYAAGGVGGGALTMGINRVLSGFAHGEISTRVDTTVAQNPRPEVAVRLSSDVTAQVGYQTGVVGPGQNPDRMLLKLDWRFLRNWSLSSTIGSSGSSILDFVWQYRY